VVQNLSPYTFFGRRAMRLAPEADLRGGLDVMAMDSFRARHVAPVAVSTFGRARHPERPHVVVIRDQRRIHVRCRTPMPAQADGEFLGEREDVEIVGAPGALSVLR
jgi:diacylglycerol kinase family enzyme